MKCFDVKAISPQNGAPCIFKHVPAEQIRTMSDGSTVFVFNDTFPSCEILSIKEVPQKTLDAMASYFDRYGTACE